MSDDSSGREAEGERADDGPELPPSRVFDLLSNQRRRSALLLLDDHGRVGLPDIAEEVTVEQTDREITDIPPEAVRDTYMMLYHSDIPKLQDASVVAYDQDSDVVVTGEQFDRVVSLLDSHSSDL